jgi:hypothetical protein
MSAYASRVIALITFVWVPPLMLSIPVFADAPSPYGICAHVSRHGDHELAAEQFTLMRQTGIRWARTDFDWTTVQSRENGPWDFSMFDNTVEMAEKAGITILPILAYDVAWATPAYRHLDRWRQYVRQTVSRYHNRLRYWEVWNEPDLVQFWKETPDPANYTLLLKASYEEIKRIDPDLQVLLGGLSGIPYDYIEGIYKAGGKDFFDIMAVHPYRYPSEPEAHSLKDDLNKLRELMVTYGDADKPVWITEIGWPTHQNRTELLEQVVSTGLETVAPDRTHWTLAVLEDGLTPVKLSNNQLNAMLPGDGRVERLSLPQIKKLTPDRYHALLMPPSESFAVEAFETIEAYVRDGGIVILTQGVPLYYTAKQSEDGSWTRQGADESYRRRLHLGWQAWWTKPDVPQSIGKLTISQPFASKIRLPEKTAPAERFLTDAALKTGDRFIPLVQAAAEGDYTGTVAAVYKLDSDLKGAVIVSTLLEDYRGITEEKQAAILPRAYLIALHSGVERMFWYNFRARENDPFYNEDHFGILHHDMKPKPAYTAMQTLNRVRPAGSIPLDADWQTGSLYYPGWKRPDGQTAFALWTSGSPRHIDVSFKGTLTEALDHLGNPADIRPTDGKLTVPLSETPIYLIGPESIGSSDAITPA